MSLTKSVITLFKKEANIELNSIEEIENYDETLFEPLNISGYCSNEDNTTVLYIMLLGGKKPKATTYYKSHIEHSSLFDSEELIFSFNKVYFVVFKNKETFYIYCLDNTNANNNGVELIQNFSLANFSSIFTANNNLAYQSHKKEIDDMLNTIRPYFGSSDQRTPFFIITWILLTHDDIAFKYDENNKPISLKEWIAINKRHTIDSSKVSNEIKQNSSWTVEENMLADTKPDDVLKAFETVLAYKLAKHTTSTLTMKEIVSKQIEKLRKTIQTLYNVKTQNNALMITSLIHDTLYVKYGSEIDINKLAFEVERNWNTRTPETTAAAKSQVYTHRMMKDLILKILGANIRDSATCYDPTCGTGGFTETFYKYCKTKNINDIIAYGNEINEDCANMAWLSGLCSDYDVRVFQSDCFDPEIKELIPKDSIDFLLMNPPYGMSKGDFLGFPNGFEWKEDPMYGKRIIEPSEWTFCRYNLDSFIKPGGWFGFVVPIQIVSENKKNIYDKQCLIESCEIWFIIRMRNGIFQPYAGAVPCLVIGKYVGKRTKTEIETWKTKLIDFRIDSGTVGDGKKQPVAYKNQNKLERLIMEKILDNKCLDGIHGDRLNSLLYETNSFGATYYEERVLKANENWIYLKVEEIDKTEAVQQFNRWCLESIHNYAIYLSVQDDYNDKKNPIMKTDEAMYKRIKVGDILELLSKSSKYDVRDVLEIPTTKVKIPFYSMIDHNNGLKGFVEKASFTDNGYYIIVGKYASKSNDVENDKQKTPIKSVYCSYLIRAPFSNSSDVFVLKPKECLSHLSYEELSYIAFRMGLEFSQKYVYFDALNSNRLLNETVELPFDPKSNLIQPALSVILKSAKSTKEILQQRDKIKSFLFPEIPKPIYKSTDKREIKNIHVSDIFDIINGIRDYDRKMFKAGCYPLVSSSGDNNGIIDYIDVYNYDGLYVSYARSGTVGSCFVQRGKFQVLNHSTGLMQLKSDYEYLSSVLEELTFIMTTQFMKRYSYVSLLNNERLGNETITNIPFLNGIIDIYALRESLMNN